MPDAISSRPTTRGNGMAEPVTVPPGRPEKDGYRTKRYARRLWRRRARRVSLPPRQQARAFRRATGVAAAGGGCWLRLRPGRTVLLPLPRAEATERRFVCASEALLPSKEFAQWFYNGCTSNNNSSAEVK